MAVTTDTDSIISFETTNEGDTNLSLTGYDEEGNEVTATVSLTPVQMGNLVGRTTKQWLGATIIAN